MSMPEPAFQERGVSEACPGDIYFTGFPGNINCLSGEKLICMKYITFPLLVLAGIVLITFWLLKRHERNQAGAHAKEPYLLHSA